MRRIEKLTYYVYEDMMGYEWDNDKDDLDLFIEILNEEFEKDCLFIEAVKTDLNGMDSPLGIAEYYVDEPWQRALERYDQSMEEGLL